MIGMKEIQAAHARIAGHIRRTPVTQNAVIDETLGAEVFLKCENLQEAGAFKSRGASNAVFSLSDEEARHGVVTHSSPTSIGYSRRSSVDVALILASALQVYKPSEP